VRFGSRELFICQYPACPCQKGLSIRSHKEKAANKEEKNPGEEKEKKENSKTDQTPKTYQGNSKARAFIGGQGDAKDSCSSSSTKDNRTDTTGYARYYLYVHPDNCQGGDVYP